MMMDEQDEDYEYSNNTNTNTNVADRETELTIEGDVVDDDARQQQAALPWSSIVSVLWTPEGRCVSGDNLVTLRITSCQLTGSVGREIGSLKRLQHLDLSNNQITSLPEELFLLLPDLRVLNVNDNRLESISPKVGRLLCLEELRVARNRLRSLPFDSLLFPPSLRLIDAEANFLDTQALTRDQLHFANSICLGLWQQCTPNRIKGTPHLDSGLFRLFIGSVQATWDLSELRRLGITHILSVGVHPALPANHGFSQMEIELSDLPTEDLLNKLTNLDVLKFIDSSAHGGCLIHCYMGISRSAAFALAWMMSREQLRLEEALNILRRCRACVQPNWGFQAQLALFLDWPRFAQLNGSTDGGSISPNPSRGLGGLNPAVVIDPSPALPTGPSTFSPLSLNSGTSPTSCAAVISPMVEVSNETSSSCCPSVLSMFTNSSPTLPYLSI